jgi:tetratricopeptide (TPR) repeat protein
MKEDMMRKTLSLLTLTCLLAPGVVSAGPADDFEEATIKGKQLIEDGVDKFDEEILIGARSHFERLLSNREMQWLTEYYMAYADYRLAILYQVRDKNELMVKYLDDGIERVNACIAKNDKFADAHGLLSALLGQKIGADPSLGMTLGMQAFTAMGNAVAHGESNPRVAMFSAISAYYTPEQFGGSKTKAADEIARAVELFAKDKINDKRLPDWGQSEAYAWQAKFFVERGELDQARKSLDSALKVNPKNGFAFSVRQELRAKLSTK